VRLRPEERKLKESLGCCGDEVVFLGRCYRKDGRIHATRWMVGGKLTQVGITDGIVTNGVVRFPLRDGGE
jgi:hypothetical protein